jgi:hypothetical protein
VKQLSGSALAIAFLGLLEALAIAKSIAHHTRQELDYNRQCLAEGRAPSDSFAPSRPTTRLSTATASRCSPSLLNARQTAAGIEPT